jgi:hypothetical protein
VPPWEDGDYLPELCDGPMISEERTIKDMGVP